MDDAHYYVTRVTKNLKFEKLKWTTMCIKSLSWYIMKLIGQNKATAEVMFRFSSLVTPAACFDMMSTWRASSSSTDVCEPTGLLYWSATLYLPAGHHGATLRPTAVWGKLLKSVIHGYQLDMIVSVFSPSVFVLEMGVFVQFVCLSKHAHGYGVWCLYAFVL